MMRRWLWCQSTEFEGERERTVRRSVLLLAGCEVGLWIASFFSRFCGFSFASSFSPMTRRRVRVCVFWCRVAYRLL